MTEFWPFGVAILGTLLAGLFLFVLVLTVRPQGPDAKSPHHKWNRRWDRRKTAERQAEER